MAIVNTADLIGKPLDWVVAKVLNLPLRLDPMGFGRDAPGSPEAGWWIWHSPTDGTPGRFQRVGTDFSPSANWQQAGEVFMLEAIGFFLLDGVWHAGTSWEFFESAAFAHHRQTGPTQLVAALRCFVSLRIGEQVEVPDEML